VSITLLRIVFSIYFFITFVITSIHVYLEYRATGNNVRKELLKNYQAFEGGFKDALWNKDSDRLKVLSSGMLKVEVVKGVQILDEGNTELINVFEKKVTKDDTSYFYFEIKLTKEWKGQKKNIGTLRVFSNHSVIYNRIEFGIKMLILFAILKMVLLLILLTKAFEKIIFRPLATLSHKTSQLDFDQLEFINVFQTEKNQSELTVLEDSVNTMITNLKKANTKIKDHTKVLETKIKESTKELTFSLSNMEAMLSHIDKAIFSVDHTGKILSPVSHYSETLFRKDIVGENGLKLLFFHLKDGSDQKNNLVQSFKGVFGGTDKTFLNLKGGLPRQVTQPDKEEKRGRVLDIQYVPLYDLDSKIEKLMFLVQDVTASEQEYLKNKEASLDYAVFMNVLPFENKEQLSRDLSSLIEMSVSSLVKMMSPGADKLEREDIAEIIVNLIMKFKGGSCSSLSELNNLIVKTQSEINETTDYDMRKVLVWVVEKLSRLFLNLMRYAEALNTLHKNGMGPGVEYSLPKDFETSIDEKREDLERMMANLLEYVFLVRNVNNLDEEKISNAPKKARLYAQFDDIISLLMNRSRLIGFLLMVAGKTKESEGYMEFSNLLKEMPSKDKLTEAALVNHLIGPYKRTQFQDS
jgi:hypothetical protein